jgi:hypothetical protein
VLEAVCLEFELAGLAEGLDEFKDFAAIVVVVHTNVLEELVCIFFLA